MANGTAHSNGHPTAAAAQQPSLPQWVTWLSGNRRSRPPGVSSGHPHPPEVVPTGHGGPPRDIPTAAHSLCPSFDPLAPPGWLANCSTWGRCKWTNPPKQKGLWWDQRERLTNPAWIQKRFFEGMSPIEACPEEPQDTQMSHQFVSSKANLQRQGRRAYVQGSHV